PVPGGLLAGMVDQEVEPAERLDRAGDCVPAERLVAYVAGEGDAAAARFLDQCLGRCRIIVLVQIEDGDVGPLLGEADRDRTADAAVAPGDQRGHAVELADAAVVAHVRVWYGRHLGAQAGLAVLLL